MRGNFVMPKSPCAQQIMRSFLATAKAPDLGCVATLKPPPFVVAPPYSHGRRSGMLIGGHAM
jgi:hypothetical protein